jgi:hypothetical protein
MHALVWNYIAFFVAATVVVLLGLRALFNHARRDQQAFARSVPGVARVLKVGKVTPSRAYGAIIMDVLIQVHRSGVEAYELSTIWSVEPGAVTRMQAGQTLAIKVDPLSPERIYSAESWAHSLGVMKEPISNPADQTGNRQ